MSKEQISRKKLNFLIFTKQCSLMSYSFELPLNLHYTTGKCLETLNFPSNGIEKVIQNLYPNIALVHDVVSICMIKIWGKSICKPS